MASLDISAAENVMRVGLNEDSELNSLLSYYRNKLDDFTRERLEWMTKFDELKHDAELQHKLEWANQHQKDRIEELERALSHHKTALYDERQSYLKLLRQNNELKLKQTADGRRIQDLMSAGQPYEDEMVMCKDVRPEISNKFIFNELNIHKQGVHPGADKLKGCPPARGAGGALKTAKNPMKQTSVPNDQQTLHELELINIKRAHELQVNNLAEQVGTLREVLIRLKKELDRLQSRYDEREEAQTQAYKNLLGRHTDIEKKHNTLAQEYFGIRLKLSEDEQKNQQKTQLLRVKNVFLAEKLKESERKAEREQKAIEQLVQRRNNDFKTKYKTDMKKKEEHLSILKEQYERVQEIYLSKIKTLEEHLSKLNDRYNDLSRKSKRQSESLRSQLKVMERRVEKEHLEKMRLQIQQLQEQERKKQQEQEREEQRRLEEVEQKKKRKTQDIKKAYDSMAKTKPSRTKKSSPSKPRQPEIDEDEQEQSMNTSDIENIKKHIRELEAKLELDKNK